MAGQETEFKRRFRKLFVWSETIEPKRGSGMGVPDILVLVREGVIIPVEVKLGTIVGKQLVPSEIRPSQIGWHDKLRRAGGTSWLVFGVKEGRKWRAFVMLAPSLEVLKDWEKGLSLDILVEWDM